MRIGGWASTLLINSIEKIPRPFLLKIKNHISTGKILFIEFSKSQSTFEKSTVQPSTQILKGIFYVGKIALCIEEEYFPISHCQQCTK